MRSQLIELMYDRSVAISLGKPAPKHYITKSLTFSLCRLSSARRELCQAIRDLFIGEVI